MIHIWIIPSLQDEAYYKGTVTAYLPKSDGEERLWKISYEDGDSEDIDDVELVTSAALYKHLYVMNQSSATIKEGTRVAKIREKDNPVRRIYGACKYILKIT